MNIVLCDDEKSFLQCAKQSIMIWAKINGHENGLNIQAFSSSEDLLEAWEHGLQIDALFLDIQIPGEMSGIALAKEIYSRNEYIPIVFMTNYGEYAEEGYTVNALRYLRKPLSEQAVMDCLDILWHRWEMQTAASIVLEMPGQFLRLPADHILYVEVLGHFCMLKTTDDQNTYKIRLSLEVFRKKLPEGVFSQCHRSYIVNIKYIRQIMGNNVTMANNDVIPMGRAYQQQFLKQFRHYYLEGGEK